MPSLSKMMILPFLLCTLSFWGAEDKAPPAGPEITFPHQWMSDSLWDDGNAEYAVYDTKWLRYGRLNPGRVAMVVVKEGWQAKKEVKAERIKDADFEVIKLNYLRDVDTGIYTYSQMSSTFVRRDTGLLRKYSTASLEACGHTSTQMKKGRLSTRSYWGDQGDEDLPWPKDAIPEDALPLYLRGLLTGPIPASISLFPSLMDGHLPILEPVDFKLVRRNGPEVKTAAGTFSTITFELSYGIESMTWQFDAKAPHTLVRFHHSNGTEYTLAKVERLPYWRLNAPKDRAWWPKRLR